LKLKNFLNYKFISIWRNPIACFEYRTLCNTHAKMRRQVSKGSFL
jgi:hypothetical protein